MMTAECLRRSYDTDRCSLTLFTEEIEVYPIYRIGLLGFKVHSTLSILLMIATGELIWLFD